MKSLVFGASGARFSLSALLVAVSIAMTLLVPAPASAQRAERRGRAAFERGATAFDAGDYPTALAEFSEAYRLTERPALLYNVGLAQDRLRMDAEALASFEAYLAAVPNSPFLEQVNSRISALRSAEQRRDAERVALEEARAEAEAAEQASAAEATARTAAAEQAEAEARASREAAAESERQREEAERERAEAEARARANRPSRWWIGLIVGIVVVGAGVGLGVGLSGGDEGFAQSDFGEVTQTLGSF